MVQEFKYLFTPLDVGPMNLRNRIVSTPHATCFPMTNDQEAYYQAEKAKGGVSLCCTGATLVDPEEAEAVEAFIDGSDDKVVPWYQKISEEVHKYDGKIAVELTTFGCVGIHKKIVNRPAVAPSPISVSAYKNVPIALSKEQINREVKLFANAAVRAEAGGFDGVIILAGHGHLLHAFLSPFANHRTDEFGGTVENRARLILMILTTIRKAVGQNIALGIRIAGDEYLEGGINTKVAKETAAYIANSGLVDWFDICHGNSGYYLPRSFQPPPMYFPVGMHTGQVATIRDAIKEVADIPVVSVGGINDPILAEKVLADGHADLVGMTRACISDPYLPNKAKQGRLNDIRQCCRCLDGCGRIWDDVPLLCAQNSVVGREKEWSTLIPAKKRKRIMVVGGGPAGLEVARVAALRGHEVTVHEKGDELGGQINIASRAPNREEYAGVVRWLIHEARKVAEINLNTEVTDEIILEENPDVTVIATGSIPCKPQIQGATDNILKDVRSLLLGKVNVGQKVVVLDETGHVAACSAADFLAEQGKEVYILNSSYLIGDFIDGITRPILYARLLSRNVTFMPLTWIRSVSNKTVTTYNTFSMKEDRLEDVDTIIYTQSISDDRLFKKIKGKIQKLHLVGDVLTPRLTIHAIHGAARLGREL
jgi:2,4-dienoyl-CoA reductase-like NADH-dependent reductase (Old Yellow Enzyme family)/thioredoxin reductase